MPRLLDIRIGTLVRISDAVRLLPHLLPLGFESFQLNGGFGVERIDFAAVADRVRDALGDAAVVSGIGFYGNPLLHAEDAAIFADYIDHARPFGCDLVTGFAGALDGRPVTESMPRFKAVWTDLAKRAADRGVRIAFENCAMGGWWESARYNVAHAPAFVDAIWNEIPHANVGLCWEPCHQLLSLVDPLPQLRRYLAQGKIFNVHGKDATVAWDVIRTDGIRGGRQYAWERHPGFGDTNWTDLISVLRIGRYAGSVDIEGFHDPAYGGELELTGQVHALRHLQHCRGGIVELASPF